MAVSTTSCATLAVPIGLGRTVFGTLSKTLENQWFWGGRLARPLLFLLFFAKLSWTTLKKPWKSNGFGSVDLRDPWFSYWFLEGCVRLRLATFSACGQKLYHSLRLLGGALGSLVFLLVFQGFRLAPKTIEKTYASCKGGRRHLQIL